MRPVLAVLLVLALVALLLYARPFPSHAWRWTPDQGYVQVR